MDLKTGKGLYITLEPTETHRVVAEQHDELFAGHFSVWEDIAETETIFSLAWYEFYSF